MGEIIITFGINLICAALGVLHMEFASSLLGEFVSSDTLKLGFLGVTPLNLIMGIIGALIFGYIGKAAATPLIHYTLHYSEILASYLADLPTGDIFVLSIGVITGLIVATLLGTAFSRLPIVGPYISLIFSIMGAIIGAKVALNKREDIHLFFNRVWFARNKDNTRKNNARNASRTYKLLDTSVLIDGRILDVIRLGFLEGVIVIPKFVLEELQKIADSGDTLKRNRGRRGLDIVRAIQADKNAVVEIAEKDYDDITEVDTKLVRLAKERGGMVATNDFNLRKVAEIQGVRVLIIYVLSNALKQSVLPLEELQIYLAKEGKEPGQAIGYLDDGTMVVVEGGKRCVNFTVPVTVTSVLQTSAGRMIFA